MEAQATGAGLEALHGGLERFWAALEPALPRPLADPWRLRFATAVAEVGANIVRHAYLATAGERPLSLRLVAYADRAEGCFLDRGVAVDERRLALPAAPIDPWSLPEGGLGLPLTRAALDVLEYRRLPGGENQWRLMKRY